MAQSQMTQEVKLTKRFQINQKKIDKLSITYNTTHEVVAKLLIDLDILKERVRIEKMELERVMLELGNNLMTYDTTPVSVRLQFHNRNKIFLEQQERNYRYSSIDFATMHGKLKTVKQDLKRTKNQIDNIKTEQTIKDALNSMIISDKEIQDRERQKNKINLDLLNKLPECIKDIIKSYWMTYNNKSSLLKIYQKPGKMLSDLSTSVLNTIFIKICTSVQYFDMLTPEEQKEQLRKVIHGSTRIDYSYAYNPDYNKINGKESTQIKINLLILQYTYLNPKLKYELLKMFSILFDSKKKYKSTYVHRDLISIPLI
jgi:hypothetical protein